MPDPIRKALASRPAARCGTCGEQKAPAAFYPSEFGKYPEPRCKSCHAKARAAERNVRNQEDAEKLRAAFAERGTWTAIEAADVMGWKRLNAGSHLETLRRGGFVERVAPGVYRFPSAGVEVVGRPAPMPAESVVLTPPATPAAPFIEAGPYFFGTTNIACIEYDDRGRVSVMLNVQESRPGGHMAPVSFELEGDEAQRFMYNISLLRGRPPVELTERIATLTRERDEARQARDEVRAEAERLRRRLAPFEAAVQQSMNA